MPFVAALDTTGLLQVEYGEDTQGCGSRFSVASMFQILGMIGGAMLVVFIEFLLGIYSAINMSDNDLPAIILGGLWVTIILLSPWIGTWLFASNKLGLEESLEIILEMIKLPIFILFIGLTIGSILVGLNNFGVFGKVLTGLIILGIIISQCFGYPRTKFSINLKSMLFDPLVNLLNPQSSELSVSWLTCILGLCLGASYLTYVTTIEYFAELSIEKIFWIAGLGLIPVLITSIPLISYLIKLMQQKNNVAKYRRYKSTLIKP